MSSVIVSRVDMTGMPEKFSGQHFKRWQHRMKIWFTTIGFISVLESDCPTLIENDPNSQKAIDEWNQRDRICHGCILLALSNVLFDVYSGSNAQTAKQLWEELDKKYNTEDLSLEKYSVAKFLKFQMVEGKSVSEQAHEFLLLLHGLADAEMKLPEKFQVMSIIEKFPKSWEDFGMSLKHRKGSLSLDDLLVAIAIEEEHRNQKPIMPVEPNANVMTTSRAKDPKGKGKTDYMKNKINIKGKI